jgi:hypothetical protein
VKKGDLRADGNTDSLHGSDRLNTLTAQRPSGKMHETHGYLSLRSIVGAMVVKYSLALTLTSSQANQIIREKHSQPIKNTKRAEAGINTTLNSLEMKIKF